MRCCFIACDHGLGHIRRVVSVCRELEHRTNASATILATRGHGDKFARRVDHFETRTTPGALINGNPDACRWHERLPALDAYDAVISDNLPEVLEVRSDAILMGSFLWHQVLDEVDDRYRRAAERLLARCRPVMIGSGLFASPALQAATRFVDVGLFQQAPITPGRGADLLVSCGYTDGCLEETTRAVRDLAARGTCSYEKVYVEPRALPNKRPGWMLPADFTPDMYAGLAAAVVRPGVGTVTETLQAGARIFCFYEDGNAELRHNARQVERHGYGVDCGTVENALALALDGKGKPGPRCTSTGALEFNGAARAADYIASLGGAGGLSQSSQ